MKKRGKKTGPGPIVWAAGLLGAAAVAAGSFFFAGSEYAGAARDWFWSTRLPELVLEAELPARVTRLGEAEPEPVAAAEPISEPGPEAAPGDSAPVGGEDTVFPIVTVPVEDEGPRSAAGMDFRTDTDKDPDLDALLNRELSFSAAGGAKVLIIHSHTTEAYKPTEERPYKASDPYRTLDGEENVTRVGDELEKVLESRGITVIHNTVKHDYPDYNSSYANALASIQKELAADPGIKVVIDLHRDALEGADGTIYRTAALVDGAECAQVGLVVGSNGSGLYHPGWEDNLSFALKLQYSMMKNYPSLSRPLKLSKYRYNQHMTAGSVIIEVGCTGNTMEEALAAVRYFGECLAEVLGA